MNLAEPLSPELEAIVTARVDQDRLKLLEWAYYLSGGATILFACLPLIHFTIFLFLGLHPHAFDSVGSGSHQKVETPPAALFLLFAGVIGVIIVLGWIFGVMQIVAARSIRHRRNSLLVKIVAGAECIFFPWGTLIGVLTFIVMERPSVKAVFA